MTKRLCLLLILIVLLLLLFFCIKQEEKELTDYSRLAKETENELLETDKNLDLVNEYLYLAIKSEENYGYKYIGQLKNNTDKKLYVEKIELILKDEENNIVESKEVKEVSKGILKPNEDVFFEELFTVEKTNNYKVEVKSTVKETKDEQISFKIKDVKLKEDEDGYEIKAKTDFKGDKYKKYAPIVMIVFFDKAEKPIHISWLEFNNYDVEKREYTYKKDNELNGYVWKKSFNKEFESYKTYSMLIKLAE